VSIWTTNPIESTFSTIRHRTRQDRGCFSRETLLALIFQVALASEKRFRRIKGYTLISRVLRGTVFVDGVEKTQETQDPEQKRAECAA